MKSIHGKDGLWPNRDEVLGKEVPVGEGLVNFPLLLRRLKKFGFEGPIIIEREISGERQVHGYNERAIAFFLKTFLTCRQLQGIFQRMVFPETICMILLPFSVKHQIN